MTHDEQVTIARAIIVLNRCRATTAVMATVTRLEGLLPLPGTPEARSVWMEAGMLDAKAAG
jgi:hypothetical protein